MMLSQLKQNHTSKTQQVPSLAPMYRSSLHLSKR